MLGAVLALVAVVMPATTGSARARPVPNAGAGHSHVSSGPAASAPAPALSADPSTGLTDGQKISVTGTGFPPETTMGIVECQAGATDQSTCDMDTLDPVETDGSGSLSLTEPVFRVITVGASSIDCALDACVLGAADENDASIVGDTAISFADVTIVPPTVSAVPSTGLLDEQKITVSGTGFSPNAPVFIAECQSPPNEANCDFTTAVLTPVDASGDFSLSYRVTRVIEPEESPIDCAQSGACEISATNEIETSQTAGTPVAFADVPIKTPVLTATPSANLDDGQEITITGKNFRPREYFALSECVAGATDASECVILAGFGGVVSARANGSGHLRATFNVARILSLIDGTVDCAQAPGCVIGAVDEDNPFGSLAASVPVTFDPDVKPLPPLNLDLRVDPTAQITPGSHRSDTAEITGKISCDRPTAVPVDFQMQVTEPVGDAQAGGFVEGQASCDRAGAKFSIPVVSVKRHSAGPFVPGNAGVILEVAADSGSSSENTTITASVTLKAPKS